MKRLVSCLLIASMVASSAPALADNTTTAPAVVTPLNQGMPAPYTGVLLSPAAVAQVIAEREAAAKALTLAVQHQADVDAAKLKFTVDQLTTTCNTDKSILQAQVDDGKRQIKILDDQLKKQTSGPGPVTWIGIGTGAGVVLTVLGIVAIGAATK